MKLIVQPSEAEGEKVLTHSGVEFIAFYGDFSSLRSTGRLGGEKSG